MTEMRWRGQTHETLHQWIHSGGGAKAAVPQLEYWEGLKGSLTDISDRLNKSLNTIGASWEGAAGESAHSGLTPLRQWADAAHSAADTMRQSAQDQADHVSTARAAMPEPVPQTTAAPSAWAVEGAKQAAKGGDQGPAAAIAKQAADHEHQERAAASASERAVQVMNNYQSASEHNAATLGQFSAPPGIVVEVGDTVVSSSPVAMHGHGAPFAPGGPAQGVAPQAAGAAHGAVAAAHDVGGAAGQTPGAGHGFGPVPGGAAAAGTAAAGGAAGAAARFTPRQQGPVAPGPVAPAAGAGAPEYSPTEGAATLGAGAGLGALGARAAEPAAGGLSAGRGSGRGGGANREREQQRPGGHTGAVSNQGADPAANPAGNAAGNPTANPAAAASVTPAEQQPGARGPAGAQGPAGAPVAPGMGGPGMGGAGGGDITRGANPYLANRGLTGAPPDQRGFDPLGRPAEGGHTGSVAGSSAEHGPHHHGGPQQGSGPQPGPAATSYAAPDMGPDAAQGGPATAPPPPAGGGPGMAGGYDDTNERSSYLVAADNVFDDEQVRVAPPVIGEDFE